MFVLSLELYYNGIHIHLNKTIYCLSVTQVQVENFIVLASVS